MPFSEQHIRSALERGEFVPHFQPLVDLRSGAIHGFEILARWNHPKLGLIAPNQFIPVIERAGLINELSTTLLTQAFTAVRSLPENFGLSVNLSPAQLHDRSLPALVHRLADDSAFSLNRLTIELTESALVNDLKLAGAIAADLKALGIRLALDDFGTGFSSLLHLQSFPFDELKLDGSFVASVMHSRQSRRITSAVVGLGISLGLQTVAEGIEEQCQADLLARQGCSLGQGYLFGAAIPAEELAAALSRQYAGVGIAANAPSTPADLPFALDAHPVEPLSQLRAIYDAVPVGLAFLDCDLRYVNLNQHLAHMNGQSVQAHLGRSVAEVLPALYPEIESCLKRALAGESVRGFEVQRPRYAPDDPPMTMLAFYSPVRDEAGEILGVSVSVVDVSAVKQQEEALHESEARLRAIFDAVPVGIVLVEASTGKVLNANPRSEQLLGFHFQPGMIWNTDGWNAFDSSERPIDPSRLPLARAMHQAETTEAEEIFLCRPDGSKLWLSLTAAPIRFENGELLGGVLVAQDIDTARNERERLIDLARELTLVVSKAALPRPRKGGPNPELNPETAASSKLLNRSSFHA
jgi:PAS domain S-box-containing protein